MSNQDLFESAFDSAVRAHDEAVAACGLAVWVGTEPTFTDRFSESPEWLSAALGSDKAARAEQLLVALQRRLGGVVLRTQGRLYPGEDQPRWSLGLYARRNGDAIWSGPPDPGIGLGIDESGTTAPDLNAFQTRLCAGLRVMGCGASAFANAQGDLKVVALCPDGDEPIAFDDPRLDPSNPSHADSEVADAPLTDDLPCFVIGEMDWQGAKVACIALPVCATVARFILCLQAIGTAATESGLSSLVLTGHPPPVDTTVSWTTITPDPAVIEINMAPYPNVTGLLAATRTLYAASAELGLAPYRLYYNGSVADSGGGGQITLGGPSPQESPFFVAPRLLPRLVRYLNRHPALSYLFAHDHIGGSGQAVRADERGRDAFGELGLALALLERGPAPDAEGLWAGLSHLLTDAAGNSHRAELNIEKLWNPHVPERGKLGLAEFRALRMQHSPERAAALAALLRAILAMLSLEDHAGPLCDHGDALHDRFALPYYLGLDLEQILADLNAAGVGLAPPLAEVLRQQDLRRLAQVQHAGCDLLVRRAVEFWPLVGDVSGQDQNTSRLVDASTTRIEICLRPSAQPPGQSVGDFADWQIAVGDVQLPLRLEQDEQGPAKVMGLRYRTFVPRHGMHPALPAQGPLQLTLWHPVHPEALRLTLHDWRPDGRAYDGLPANLEEATARRLSRAVAEVQPAPVVATLRTPPPQALTPHALDLRWLGLGPTPSSED